MKRPLTKTGSILNVVLFSILTVFFTYLFIELLINRRYYYNSGTELAFIVVAPLIGISITQIIFSAKIIGISSFPKEKFAKKFGIIITSIVFSFLIFLAFVLYLSLTYYVLTYMYVISILSMAIIVTSSVFYIVDMARNKKLPDSQPEQQTEAQATVTVQQAPTYSDTSVEINKKAHVEQKQTFDFEAKLQKLSALKQQGMITQEEFDRLKQNLIEKELNS